MEPDAPTVPPTLAFSASESLMWQAEADRSLQFRIVGVVRLGSEPDAGRLRDRVERLTRAVPRLRHRIVGSPAPGLRPHWELDPYFDLSYHLRRVHLPDGSGDRELLELAALARQDDFPLDRSPWRMIVVTGLADGEAAVVLVMNHVITDGIGAVRMASLLLDLDPEGPSSEELGPLPEVPDAQHRTTAVRLLAAVAQEAEQLGALRSLAALAVGGARHPRRLGRTAWEATNAVVRFADQPASGSPLPHTASPAERYLTLQAPVAELKAAGRAAGGRLNDVYLAALVGGFRRYHDLHNLQVTTLNLTVPVNMRSETSGPAGNDMLLKFCTVPADISDPAARIAAIAQIAGQEQNGASNAVSQAATQSLSRLPGPVLRHALRRLADTLDLPTTNVPGVPVPLFLAGVPVRSLHAFINRGRSPLTAALMSYNGTAHIALNIDPVAIPDGEVLVECLEAELVAVLRVGADGQPGARASAASSDLTARTPS